MLDWGRNHQSRYSLVDLGVYDSPHALSDDARMRFERSRGFHFMQRPTISYKDYMSDPKGRAWAIRTLHSAGLIFVDGIPSVSQEKDSPLPVTMQLAQRIGPVMNTFYGSHWNVKSVENAENLAYTNKKIGWHQDLLYFETPPGIQVLHCLKQAESGGETLFVDSVAAADRFELLYPKEFKILSNVSINFEFKKMGISLNQNRPVFAAATSGRSHRRVFWSPEWQGKLALNRRLSLIYGAFKTWEDFLDEMEFLSAKLSPNSAVLFDNLRMLHARTSYEGDRHLQGCYLSRDEFRTQLFSDSVQNFKFSNSKD